MIITAIFLRVILMTFAQRFWYKKTKITTALPDKMTFKLDKKCPKHPKFVF